MPTFIRYNKHCNLSLQGISERLYREIFSLQSTRRSIRLGKCYRQQGTYASRFKYMLIDPVMPRTQLGKSIVRPHTYRVWPHLVSKALKRTNSTNEVYLQIIVILQGLEGEIHNKSRSRVLECPLHKYSNSFNTTLQIDTTPQYLGKHT